MTRVKIETNLGALTVELDSARAPKTVANFLQYVKSGFYDGTIFHRVIKTFMIQGGGFTADMQRKDTRPAVANEADNGLKNRRGTIAMARTGDPNSATSQFFVNTVDNAALDFTAKTQMGWGYCVFGHVVSGLEVLDKIAAVPTHTVGIYANVPVDAVTMSKVSVVVPAKE